ncbi:MAG: glutamate--tRNA ligase [Patescibacteria group bacterium]
MADVRVRIAPSPTGKFHLGTARTALFNYLFARKNEGKFILRIEDTDNTRSEGQYVNDILEGMKWLGLHWDEGPEVDGKLGPYFQSQRLPLYDQHVQQLLEQKKAYKCFCTPVELEAERTAQQQAKQPPKYSGKCRKLSAETIAANEKAGQPFAVRFIVDHQTVTVEDLIRGPVEFDAALIGDFPIVRSDGAPLFVLTNTIDDSLMGITHVFRGEEHLANTAKQLLLCKALGFLEPQFGHLPLIFNADRSKMSKRKNPVSITDDYRAKGYLPEALINYLALLGWSSGTDREIFSLNELVKEFQIERVGKSAAIFDPEKLLWTNGYYIRSLQLGDLATRCKEFIKDGEILQKVEEDPEFFLQAIQLVQERLKLLGEIEGLIEFFYREPQYEAGLLIARKSDEERTLKALELAREEIKKLKKLTLDQTEFVLRDAADDNGLKAGEMLWAVRVALTGKEASPGVFELLEAFGKDEALKRIETAIQKLKK